MAPEQGFAEILQDTRRLIGDLTRRVVQLEEHVAEIIGDSK